MRSRLKPACRSMPSINHSCWCIATTSANRRPFSQMIPTKWKLGRLKSRTATVDIFRRSSVLWPLRATWPILQSSSSLVVFRFLSLSLSLSSCIWPRFSAAVCNLLESSCVCVRITAAIFIPFSLAHGRSSNILGRLCTQARLLHDIQTGRLRLKSFERKIVVCASNRLQTVRCGSEIVLCRSTFVGPLQRRSSTTLVTAGETANLSQG